MAELLVLHDRCASEATKLKTIFDADGLADDALSWRTMTLHAATTKRLFHTQGSASPPRHLIVVLSDHHEEPTQKFSQYLHDDVEEDALRHTLFAIIMVGEHQSKEAEELRRELERHGAVCRGTTHLHGRTTAEMHALRQNVLEDLLHHRTATSSTTRWPLMMKAAVVLLVVLVALVAWAWGGAHDDVARTTPACGCARAASLSNNPIASLLAYSSRSRIDGLHLILPDGEAAGEERLQRSMAFLGESACSGTTLVVDLRQRTFLNAVELHTALRQPFDATKKHATRCVVWVVSEKSLTTTGGVLKALLEENQLLQKEVVPRGSKGVLLLPSSRNREGLKAALPHRVVHMFRSERI